MNAKPLRVPRKEITERYRERHSQQFGTMEELLDSYGYNLYDEIMREKYGGAYQLGKYAKKVST